MIFDEAETRYTQAKVVWEQLNEEFEMQKNQFFVRCTGSYFDDPESIQFTGDELDSKKALDRLKKPRQEMRFDLVSGIQAGRKMHIHNRLERINEVDRRCKQIMDRFKENPFLNNQALVAELGRLQVEQAEHRLNARQTKTDIARIEEGFKEQLLSFDSESKRYLEAWKNDLHYLEGQYRVCCELKLHVENALRERDQAEEELLTATFYNTNQ